MNEIMLTLCKPNKIYQISKVDIKHKDLLIQLENLGFCKGKNIEIKCSNYGKKSFLVTVMGINYALDKMVCEKVFVYDK